MKLLNTLAIAITPIFVFAQTDTPSKITVVKHTTDATGKTSEVKEVKTGKEATTFYNTHPEIRNAANTGMHTTKVTITKRTVDPVTGKIKVEKIVKEGADAENFDWREAGYTPPQKSGMAEIVPTSQPKQEKSAPTTTPKIEKNNTDTEDISIEIDNTTDAQNRAYLGVSSSELPSNKGVVVDFVLKSSPAAIAGLTEWDIITAINGVAVHNAIELQKVLEPFEPSDKIKIDFLRNNEQKSVIVTLADSGNMDSGSNFAAEKTQAAPPTKPAETRAGSPRIGATLVGSMKNVPLADFRIYPNPSGSGMFTVQFKTTKNDYLLIKVLDINGKSEIFTRTVNGIASDYSYQIDVQHKTPGDYTLIVTHNTVEYRETLHYQP